MFTVRASDSRGTVARRQIVMNESRVLVLGGDPCRDEEPMPGPESDCIASVLATKPASFFFLNKTAIPGQP